MYLYIIQAPLTILYTLHIQYSVYCSVFINVSIHNTGASYYILYTTYTVFCILFINVSIVKVVILVTCSVGLIIFQSTVGAFIYNISRIYRCTTRIETGLYMGPP